jgi:hypothetical protein
LARKVVSHGLVVERLRVGGVINAGDMEIFECGGIRLSVRAAGSQQLARSFRSPSQLALRNDRERSAQIYLLVLQRFVTSILTVANRVVDFGVQRICHDTSLAVSVVRGVIIDSRYPGKAVRLPRMSSPFWKV